MKYRYEHLDVQTARLRTSVEYIRNHLDDDLSLKELAGRVEMSTYQFVRMFREGTGIPPHQYILRERIAMAKKMLTDPNCPIADIAAQLRFADQSHFGSVFKRLVGATPLSFRNRAIAGAVLHGRASGE
ncbi:MAG TPA: AraC family transcriptional regulator [Candidatus Acidoferrum sp.]|jgi:AraC family transcriptional regulator|nr:AraC family transcriptional regulator [Candidatus Acidoferrum sp.]